MRQEQATPPCEPGKPPSRSNCQQKIDRQKKSSETEDLLFEEEEENRQSWRRSNNRLMAAWTDRIGSRRVARCRPHWLAGTNKKGKKKKAN
ncbi:hypothetical protein SORBI_3006G065000 [Sorghum bicolor]|uniref:Uncharacterized protein n=1 Tax=Sorghum bicolor TaxID=4558 RepID=A0A1B6PKL6_SORBI|nr:hypothetical protein SORBI_3006G065000 [Sorghum bicolor]